VRVIILSSIFAALTGILGFVLGNLGIETFLAIKRPFPYGIENVIQAKGFTPSPNMLASIIMIGVFFQLQKLSKNRTIPNRKDYLIFLTLLIGFSLTFSKTVVCLLIGIILILYLNHKSILSFTWRLATSFVIIGLFIAYIIATHFIIVEKDKSFEHLKGDYIAGPAIIELANYSIYPSQYWSLKKIAFQASVESFPWGLGPGKFNNFAYESKKNSSYPTHVPYPDPHSTYLGTLAEIGLLGFAALFGIITFIIKYSRNFVKDNLVNQHLIVCLPVIFIVIGIEAICTDVMNFRYYWIVLAILVNTNFKE
jgi:O-antigen ligase